MREANDEQKKKFDENGQYPERMRKDAVELYERENYPETVREESEEQEKKLDETEEYRDRLGEDDEEQKKKWERQKYDTSYFNRSPGRLSCRHSYLLHSSVTNVWYACATGSWFCRNHGYNFIFHAELFMDNGHPLL